MLSHGIPLVICLDLFLMTVNPSMSRESRFPPLPLGADGADPHRVGPCSQMGWARVLHAAVWVEAAREVGPGQEGG